MAIIIIMMNFDHEPFLLLNGRGAIVDVAELA